MNKLVIDIPVQIVVPNEGTKTYVCRIVDNNHTQPEYRFVLEFYLDDHNVRGWLSADFLSKQINVPLRLLREVVATRLVETYGLNKEVCSAIVQKDSLGGEVIYKQSSFVFNNTIMEYLNNARA